MNVDGVEFVFPENWTYSKYDDWAFYRKQWQKMNNGQKGIDLIAKCPNNSLWLIEVKDYRSNKKTKILNLPEMIAGKVVSTLGGLLAASVNANISEERELAKLMVKSSKIRVVLQVIQPKKKSKLFPRPVDPSLVTQKLKSLVKPLDPHPLVIDCTDPCVKIGWRISL